MEKETNPPESAHDPGGQAAISLRCADLRIAYGDLVAVDGLSFEVHAGECFGLVGPNGAGKTSSVEAFEGLIRPVSGVVELLGMRWGQGMLSDRRLRRRFGVALQETQLPEKLTVFEILRLFRSFYPEGLSPAELVDLLGLAEKRNARVGNLSGGQRQRLAVACALVGSPDLLFLDEPTTGLDPSARRDIWDHVEKFVHLGNTVILTTHYMEEAQRLCDRVAVMDRGKLAALDTPAALVRSLGAGEIVEIETGGEFPVEAVEALPGVGRVERRNAYNAIYVDDTTKVLPAVLSELKERGVQVRSVSTHRANLEDVFIRLTGRGLADA